MREDRQTEARLSVGETECNTFDLKDMGDATKHFSAANV